MTEPKPPRKNAANQPPRARDDDTGIEDVDIVAEDIEAGYDIQSDAATRSLADDPASSSDPDA